MGLFAFIKKLFGSPSPTCPRCGFSYKWDGSRCAHCDYPNPRPAQSIAPAPQQAAPRAPAAPFASTAPAASGQPARTAPAPRQAQSLNLDASQFTPISGRAAVAAAKGVSDLGTNPWWGRLDTIPPATDGRTLLIDRSLVAHGLLTPEDLVEIHKIGDQMLAIKGDLALAAEQAREVVAASEADRQRIREEKKAQAAERKKRHAEAVAHRRATDIIFLGRGVSHGLADRRANVEKLHVAGLPVLATPADVAKALALPIKRLRWLAFHAEAAAASHYIRFTIPKKSGGVRELAAPHRNLAAAQQWILNNILEKLPTHPAAHGFVKGRSIRTNALPHVGRHTLVNADLKDFFPSITFHRIRGAFAQLGYSPAVATILALLCTEAPRRTVEYSGKTFHVATGPRALPQGACTSPALSNLIARRLDARLAGIAGKLGWQYTRYADDLSFSAEAESEPARMTGYLLARIRHIAQDEGFAVNEKKTRVLKRSTAMAVTGIVVNRRPGVRRATVRRLRAILHRAKTQGLAAQNRQQHPNFAGWVQGMVAYINMVNPDQARPLQEAYAALKNP